MIRHISIFHDGEMRNKKIFQHDVKLLKPCAVVYIYINIYMNIIQLTFGTHYHALHEYSSIFRILKSIFRACVGAMCLCTSLSDTMGFRPVTQTPSLPCGVHGEDVNPLLTGPFTTTLCFPVHQELRRARSPRSSQCSTSPTVNCACGSCARFSRCSADMPQLARRSLGVK